MASSDTSRGVRHVKCPRCHSVLQEPGAPVYQCGGCGATLRAKNRSGESPSRSSLPPPQSRHLGSGDVASTSSRSSTPTPDGRRSSGQQATAGTTSRRESGDLVSARRTHGSGDVASTSSTPDATSNSRQHATTGTTSRCESGDLVSTRRHGSGDIASTSSTPDATRSTRQDATTGTTSRCDSGDLVSARKPGSGDIATTSSTPDASSGRRQDGTDTAIQRERSDLSSARTQVPLMERKEHDPSTNRGVDHSFEFSRERYAGDAERSASFPGISVRHNRGSRDATSELQADAEERSKSQTEFPDAARTKHSGDQAAVQPLQVRVPEEPAQKPVQAAEPLPSRDAAAPAVAGGKPPSPPRHELQAEEDLAPLRQKILKTVDELRGDLSELFRKSPDLNPTTTTTRARPPRLPNKQDGHVARGAAASTLLPARGARRHAAAAGADHHRAARAMKPGQVAAAPPLPRGLPSRRYRRCRADPCYDNTAQQPRPCHHGCCRHSTKSECSSCRGHCCRPVRAAQEPPSAPRKPPPAAASKRRPPPPRHHCRPVLKGAPFIICSSCFKLVQVPADFAVATNRLRKLRCGACSVVLSYSYRDPARKKKPVDELSTDGSDQVRGGGGKGYDVDDPFARFVDEFGLSSYSATEDERSPPLHVSRNTSLDTLDGGKAVGRLHRLMGYGSASELLLRHSPDLYESFDDRTTPDYDRKGKGVCVDDDEDDDGDFDDSDDEDDSGVLRRSAARGAVWPLPGQGAIRIKS